MVTCRGAKKCKNLGLKPQLSLINHIPKTEYILVELGSLDSLGLLADLNGLMKSKGAKTCFVGKVSS